MTTRIEYDGVPSEEASVISDFQSFSEDNNKDSSQGHIPDENTPKLFQFYQSDTNVENLPPFDDGLNLIPNNQSQNQGDDVVSQHTFIAYDNKKILGAPLTQRDPINTTKPTSTTKFIAKKKGRKKKGSTQKGIHTKYSPDNRRDNYWAIFLEIILNLSNDCIPKKMGQLKKTNFAQQFGSNYIAKSEKFLKLKIYQYFCYNTIFNDTKDHNPIGNRNYEIIIKMVNEVNDPAFNAIMSSTIEEMFTIFKNNEKHITKKGQKIELPNFKTINEALIDLQTELEEENVLSAEEIQDELIRFINLVIFIKEEGKKNERKEKKLNNINYVKIPELEDN